MKEKPGGKMEEGKGEEEKYGEVEEEWRNECNGGRKKRDRRNSERM